jgi:hypothetical protein
MRSNSLFGTRPENIKLSVPRLSAPWSARTQTEPVGGGKSTSSRTSARPGATYQSACAMSFRSLDTLVSRDFNKPAVLNSVGAPRLASLPFRSRLSSTNWSRRWPRPLAVGRHCDLLLLAQPTPSADVRFLALPPVHRADLEGQQRVESVSRRVNRDPLRRTDSRA